MVTIEQAQAQVTSARTQLEQRRQEAERAKTQLAATKASLPEIRSQEALRSKYAGLSQRITRRKVVGAEKQIAGEQEKVESYKQELTKFEKEKIGPVEKEIASVKKYNATIKKLRKAALKGNLSSYIESGTPYEKKLAKKMQFQMSVYETPKVSSVEPKDVSGEVNFYYDIEDPSKQYIREGVTGELKESPYEAIKGVNLQPRYNVPSLKLELPRKLPIAEIKPVEPLTKGQYLSNLYVRGFQAVTGRTPREAFRFVTGSQERDITKPLTLREAGYEITQVPMRTTTILAGATGIGVEKTAEQVMPEGIDVKIKGEAPKDITFYEPAFGTVTPETSTGFREIKLTTQGRAVVKRKILEPERLGEGAAIGFTLGATIAQPSIYAPGFVTEGTKIALDTSQSAGARILGGAEALAGGSILAGKATRFLNKEIEIRVPTRQLRVPQAVEVQKIVKIGKTPTKVSLYTIKGETSPPIAVARNKIWKQAIGLKPKVKVIPAKTYTVKSPELIINEQSFLTATVQKGKRFATMSEVVGQTRGVAKESLSELPRLERFGFKRLAEQRVGRPVRAKDIGKFFPEESQLSVSYVGSENLLKLKPGVRVAEFKTIPAGKRVSQQIGVTESKVLGKIEEGELITSKTLFKDVTMPGARAAGQTPKLNTLLLKISDNTEEGIRIIKPANIEKTPFSRTFTGQVEEQVVIESAKVSLPKPSTSKPSVKLISQPETKIDKVSPRIVSGASPTSIYAATGQYEQAQYGIPINRFDTGIKSVETQVNLISPKLDTGLNVGLKSDEIIKSDFKIDTGIKSDIKIDQGLKQDNQLKQDLKLSQELKSDFKNNLLTQTVVKQKQQKTTKQTKPVKPFGSETSIAKWAKKRVKETGGEFEVFQVIKKKATKTSEEKGIESAAKALSKGLKSGLQASGYLVEKRTGKKVKASKVLQLLGNEFRAGKTDLFKVVERKEKRLRKGTTGKEVQYFRKKKGGKKKSSWL